MTVNKSDKQTVEGSNVPRVTPQVPALPGMTPLGIKPNVVASRIGEKFVSRNSHSSAVVTLVETTRATVLMQYDDGSTLRVGKNILVRDWMSIEDIVAQNTKLKQHLDTAILICKEQGHEWGWMLHSRQLLREVKY